jgi:hypothetical protein
VDPLQGVVITSREIYDAVVRLTGRVDVLIENQHNVTEDVKDHEGRLRTLEHGRWPLPTVSVLLALAALVATIVPKLLT